MPTNWSTQNELDFIKDMVSGKTVDYRPFTIPLEDVLRNYIKCAKHRQENGKTKLVNWDKCIEVAEQYLKEFSDS